MYVNDFDLNGSVEQIICSFNGEKSYPVTIKDDLVGQIPSLENKYKKHADYKEATISDIFADAIIQRSVVLQARFMESCVLMNTGKGNFQVTPLPAEAQFSPVYALAADDFDHDGICDILLGGNQYRAKPQTGIYDGSYGQLIKGTSEGTWYSVPPLLSGFSSTGEIRDLEFLKINGQRIIAVARNNDNLRFYKY
jgi:hypothetical protein